MNKNLKDLIDLDKVSKLLEGFNKATGFVTAIIDLEGNELSKSGWRHICTDFHRVHPKTLERCKYSDTVLAEKIEKGEKYHAYTCLNGLIDVAVPLELNKEHVANLFSGQFLFEEPDIDFFKKQAHKFEFNEKEYLKALSEVPVISEEKAIIAIDFLLQMTNLIGELGREKTEQVELNKRLRESEKKLQVAIQNLDEKNQQLIVSEQKLKKEKIFSEKIVENADAIIVGLDKDHIIRIFNHGAEKITGYKREEVIKKDWNKIFFPKEIQNEIDTEWKNLWGIKSYSHINPILAKSGEERIISWQTTGLYDSDDISEHLHIAIGEDITEQELANEKIRHISFHDNLTNLYNRRFMEKEIKRLNTEKKLPISFLMADLDGLKLVNDTYGHNIGDVMLKRAAEIFKNNCRKKDVIARWGGDEFVILLPQTTKKETDIICNRIMSSCKDVDVQNVPLSLSLGCACKESIDKDISEILSEAETYMYRHKLIEKRSTKSDIVETLLVTLKEKSQETEEHTRRMKKVAQQIAEKIALSEVERARLDLVIKLHDIGKINISEDILTKKSALTNEEWDIIKKHPETSCKILLTTENFSHVAKDVLSHHEWWDGSGYPQGLKGEEIPLLARIASIVDAYDVMLNGRCYKDPMLEKEIVAEFKRCSRTQFDSKLVDVFLSILKDNN